MARWIDWSGGLNNWVAAGFRARHQAGESAIDALVRLTARLCRASVLARLATSTGRTFLGRGLSGNRAAMFLAVAVGADAGGVREGGVKECWPQRKGGESPRAQPRQGN